MGQNALAINEIAQVNIKSFNLVSEITRTNLFSKLEIKPVSRLIIFNLANMYNPKLGYSFPGVEKLCKCTGYTDRQIKAGLKELSEKGLIVRIDKKIYFTRKFYEALKIIENNNFEDENFTPENENISSKSENISPTCINRIKTDNKNNFVKNKILFFETSKQKKSATDKTRELIQEYKLVKRGSPLDYTKEQAIEYLNNLMPKLQNSYFAVELRKKWNLAQNADEVAENATRT